MESGDITQKRLSRTRFHSSGDITPPCRQPLVTLPRTEVSPTLICTALFEIMFDIQLPTMTGTFFSTRAAVIFGKVVLSNAPSMSMKTPRVDSLLSKRVSQSDSRLRVGRCRWILPGCMHAG